MPERLWSTDFDGTLYAGPRRDAEIAPEMLNTIADWLAAGGWFHVLSGGSMSGLARDGFDLVPQLVNILTARGCSRAAEVIAERVSFSMSNGTEHYTVAEPHACMTAGQVQFEAAQSTCVERSEAERFSRELDTLFSIDTMALDSPIGAADDRTSAMFLRQTCTPEDSRPRDTVATVNDYLRDVGSTLHVTFVRQFDEDGKTVRRFDGFPVAADGSIDKAGSARHYFPRFASVIYTGDQPRGNDKPVFDYMDEQPTMRPVPVRGPKDVIEAIRAAC